MNIDPVEPPFLPAPPPTPLRATLFQLDPRAFGALRPSVGDDAALDATLRVMAEGRADELDPGRRRQLGLVDS